MEARKLSPYQTDGNWHGSGGHSVAERTERCAAVGFSSCPFPSHGVAPAKCLTEWSSVRPTNSFVAGTLVPQLERVLTANPAFDFLLGRYSWVLGGMADCDGSQRLARISHRVDELGCGTYGQGGNG